MHNRLVSTIYYLSGKTRYLCQSKISSDSSVNTKQQYSLLETYAHTRVYDTSAQPIWD